MKTIESPRRAAAVMATLLIAAVVTVSGARARAPQSGAEGFQPDDLSRLQSVGDVQLSPDGTLVAYSVTLSDRPGRPYSQVRVMDVASGRSMPLTRGNDTASGPRWSPDGLRLAYFGQLGGESGLIVANPDGTGAAVLAPVQGTNHPLPSSGERLAWAPDGRRIAYLSATPGPEDEQATGDPMVITRYLFKPTASEGLTRFNDNRRLHIFVVDVETREVRQLTEGIYYEHSIDWSPGGEEILFVSNREADSDRVFNYDIFAVRVAGRAIRRLTETKSAEYFPRWSPDGSTIAYLGTKRPLTSSETTMEDTHVWLIGADGANARELGAPIDNRQGRVGWSPDGARVLATVQDRGNVHLYALPVAGDAPERIVGGDGEEDGSVGAWSMAEGDRLAYAQTKPDSPAELYFRRSGADRPRKLTRLNEDLLGSRRVAPVERFTFTSFDGTPIEVFLTRPLELDERAKHPLIVMIHGGPHGQQGPSFNHKAQVYAAQGWATLMVNYRGSTGYGQALADKILKDQNGGEAEDVVAGVDAALARYRWIDRNRLGIEGGSYGGQLTNWIITQTDRFRAAIPIASISNLVTQNYLAYYHDYLAVEFGGYPHEDGIIDELWRRSAIRFAGRVTTPTMLVHGENDNDVPIEEAEQFYIALKDVGVEVVMVRYPREGHGIRETAHAIDLIERSLAWYTRHFAGASPTAGM